MHCSVITLNLQFTNLAHVKGLEWLTFTALLMLHAMLQEYNEVVAQFLTEDSSFDALVPKVQLTCDRLRTLGLPTPHVVYLDNTVAGENSIRAAVPGVTHVCEDHFHAMRRVTSLLPDDLPEKSEWVLVCVGGVFKQTLRFVALWSQIAKAQLALAGVGLSGLRIPECRKYCSVFCKAVWSFI